MHTDTVPTDAAPSPCVAISATISSTTSCPEVTSAAEELDAVSAVHASTSSSNCRSGFSPSSAKPAELDVAPAVSPAVLDGAPGGSEVDTCTNTMIIANGLQV